MISSKYLVKDDMIESTTSSADSGYDTLDRKLKSKKSKKPPIPERYKHKRSASNLPNPESGNFGGSLRHRSTSRESLPSTSLTRQRRDSSIDSLNFNDDISWMELEGEDYIDVDLEKMRCSSRSIEQITGSRRRQPNSADSFAAFPGLCLNASLFKSGSLMKFCIIGNELHNLVLQLKRVKYFLGFGKALFP